MISLYLKLDVDQEVDRIKDEVLRTDLEFINVDYHEAAKYLVLNWSEEEFRRSSWKRILPRKRGKRGTRQGIRGVVIRRKQRGEQE